MVCTGNVCRSPMAEALLRRGLADRGVSARVSSAGSSAEGMAPTDEIIELMADRGIDVRGHRSRLVDARSLDAADLMVGMARHHVRDAAMVSPGVLPRAFTLKELTRLGREAGPVADGESVRDWAARVGSGRPHTAHLGEDPDDDVVDPIGRRFKVYKQVAAELDEHVARLVELLAPGADR